MCPLVKLLNNKLGTLRKSSLKLGVSCDRKYCDIHPDSKALLGGGNSNIFYFHPYLGKMNPF